MLPRQRALCSLDQRYISAGHRQTAGGGKGKAECYGVPASQGSELTFGGERLSPTRLPPSWIPERHYLPGHLVVCAPSFPVAFQELLGKADEAEHGPTQYLLPFLGRAPSFHHCTHSGLAQSYIHALCAMPVLSGRKTGMSTSQADPPCHRLCLPSTTRCLPGHLSPLWSCASPESVEEAKLERRGSADLGDASNSPYSMGIANPNVSMHTQCNSSVPFLERTEDILNGQSLPAPCSDC